MQSKLFFLIAVLLALAGLERGMAQTPVPLGLEDVVWQKEGLSVTSLAFSPTQLYIAVGTTSWPVLLDLNTGVEIKKFICKNSITGLCFSDDGNFLFTGNSDGQFIKWNTSTWDSVIIDDITDRSKAILMIDYDKEKDLVATASAESGMKIYNSVTNEKILEWKDMPIVDSKFQRKAAVTSVSFRNDGKVIAIGMKSADQTWLYDIETRQIIKIIQGEDGLYSPTKNELIVKKIKDSNGSELLDGLDYYKFDESEIPENLDIGELSVESAYVFNSFGNQLIVAGRTGKIKIFDLITKNEKSNFEIRDNATFSIVAVSNNNHYLITRTAGILFLVDIVKYTNIVENYIVDFNIYPNPSQDSMMIQFFLEHSNIVTISKSDLQGIVISNVFSGFQENGQHNLPFSTDNLATGHYFITIESNGQVISLPFEIIR